MLRSSSRVSIVVLLSWRGAFAQSNQIEPRAGTWKTWVISSGRDFRIPPPPDAATTTAELAWLRSYLTLNDARTAEQITFWDAGAPSYRWIDLISKRINQNQPTTAFLHRVFTYLTMAMHDATIAAWGPSTSITASARVNWIPRYGRYFPHHAAHRIRPNMRQPLVQPRRSSRTCFRTKPHSSSHWRKRRPARVSMPVCNSRATIRLAWSWGGASRSA